MTLIEAAKQAREALQRSDYLGWQLNIPIIKALDQAIAEAEQEEPVAWRNAAIRVGEDLCSVGPFGYYDMTAEQWLDWALSVVTVHAPPPKREWQGLTDEEMKSIQMESWNKYPDQNMEKFDAWKCQRLTQAKLKEKNHD